MKLDTKHIQNSTLLGGRRVSLEWILIDRYFVREHDPHKPRDAWHENTQSFLTPLTNRESFKVLQHSAYLRSVRSSNLSPFMLMNEHSYISFAHSNEHRGKEIASYEHHLPTFLRVRNELRWKIIGRRDCETKQDWITRLSLFPVYFSTLNVSFWDRWLCWKDE